MTLCQDLNTFNLIVWYLQVEKVQIKQESHVHSLLWDILLIKKRYCINQKTYCYANNNDVNDNLVSLEKTTLLQLMVFKFCRLRFNGQELQFCYKAEKLT